MSLKFRVRAGGGPPAGQYVAEFFGIEGTTHDEFGDGLRWDFIVVEGPHEGERASRFTSDCPTPRNAAGRMLSELTGQTLTVDAEIDVSACIGRRYAIVVEETSSGSTRVANVTPIQETPAAAVRAPATPAPVAADNSVPF